MAKIKLHDGLGSFRDYYKRYAKSAKLRGYEFVLTPDDFYKLTQQQCHYCGLKDSINYKAGNCAKLFIGNGIDRVDNTKGYTLENSLTCCKMCNKMKSVLGAKEFLDHVSRIYNYQANK